MLAQLASQKGLTVEETALLHRYLARVRVESADSPEPPNLVGRTVGDLITEQRQWETAHAEGIAADRQHASNWKARVSKQMSEMNEALAVTVLESSDVPDSGGDLKQTRSLMVRMTLLNRGPREIAEVEGALRYSDVYGRDLFDGSLTIREPLPPGETVERSHYLDCVPFMDNAGPMQRARLADTKVIWEPRSIRYSDGTALAISDE